MSTASRADEVEAFVKQHDGGWARRETGEMLREYAALLREDRCAALVEALGWIAHLDTREGAIAHNALGRYRMERGDA